MLLIFALNINPLIRKVMIYYFKDFGFGGIPICLEALSEYCEKSCDLCPVGVSNLNLLSML